MTDAAAPGREEIEAAIEAALNRFGSGAGIRDGMRAAIAPLLAEIAELKAHIATLEEVSPAVRKAMDRFTIMLELRRRAEAAEAEIARLKTERGNLQAVIGICQAEIADLRKVLP